MDKEQFEYTKYTHTTVDISHSTSSSFSLEVPMGVRFISVGRLFTPEEEADLEPVVGCDEL